MLIEDLIEEAIIKLFCTMPHHSKNILRHLHADSHENNMCFQIFSLDFMLDAKLNPLLLDIQDMPTMETTNHIDTVVLREVFMGAI
jgi:hypothetical protein